MIVNPPGSIALAATVLGIFGSGLCFADPVTDFYKGKTVTIIVGAAPGGIYDLTARAMAQHLRRYIPGNPVVIVQNMPGASHVVATEYSYNLAPRDGTSLLVVQPSVILNKFMNPSAKYDVQDWTWIGRAEKLTNVGVVWHTSPVRTLGDARERELIFGANSVTGPTSLIPWALNRLAGTRIKVIEGYDSEVASILAMQRGEIEGLGNAAVGDISQWLENGEMRALYTTGIARLASLSDVPTIVEVVQNEQDRPIMNLIAGLSEIGITLMAPPGIPVERVTALQSAFGSMTKDQAFAGDLERLGFAVDFMSGLDLTRLVREKLNPSSELIARFKATIAPE
jgi:tripartite-type tricarboxylate transporter receptor subunit TctC